MAQTSKQYPANLLKRFNMLLPTAIALLTGAAFLQSVIDPQAKQYHRGEVGISTFSGGLNNEFLILPLLGFREAAAGLLWVRCDEFFHSGDYDAILPLVRLITWLDPHADNVYSTGAWHLDYNFTDSSERSDRRYIAPALSLLDEGIVNNMTIPDIKFEKGWQCFDKVKDYNAAVAAYQLAIEGPHKDGRQSTGDYAPYACPLKCLHMLAHTYEHMGRIPDALEAWQKALDRSREMLDKNPKDSPTIQLRSAETHNYAEALQRYKNRYTASGHDSVNPTKEPAVFRSIGGKAPGQWDTALEGFIDVPRAQVFKIHGRLNAADGARVDVRITDIDYKDRVGDKSLLPMTAPDQKLTILIDSISVKKGNFSREMDMSKDPKMYSFSNDKKLYKIVLTFNSRTTAPHVQDFFGWNGEGMTHADKKFLMIDTHPELNGTKMIGSANGEGPTWDGKTLPWDQHDQPNRIIRITYKINQQQVLGQKPITKADIIENDAETTFMLK